MSPARARGVPAAAQPRMSGPARGAPPGTLPVAPAVDPDAAARALGQLVRRLRADGGLSQEALADRVGVHRTYLGLVERGAVNVTIPTLLRLAAALDRAPGVLLDAALAEVAPPGAPRR